MAMTEGKGAGILPLRLKKLSRIGARRIELLIDGFNQSELSAEAKSGLDAAVKLQTSFNQSALNLYRDHFGTKMQKARNPNRKKPKSNQLSLWDK